MIKKYLNISIKITRNCKLFVLHDDFVPEQLLLAVLNVPAERLDLFVVQHEADPPAGHDLLLADTGGGHPARPAPLGSARVGVVADLEESDGGEELVSGAGTNVPHPEEPLGRLPDTLHVEQIPANRPTVRVMR